MEDEAAAADDVVAVEDEADRPWTGFGRDRAANETTVGSATATLSVTSVLPLLF